MQKFRDLNKADRRTHFGRITNDQPFFIAQIHIDGTRIDVMRRTSDVLAFDAEVVLRNYCDVKMSILALQRKFIAI